MNPDRWREVSRIYGAVLTKPESDRPTTLASLCGDDEELRAEVESLLKSGTDAGLIDRAATERPSTLGLIDGRAIGTQIGAFRIDSLLGVGGMGEVYRARDTKLNRDVAIKILPPAFANDPERLARFKREAQVLAQLNHPNIGHIYGFEDGPVGQAGPAGQAQVHALVLELVEGPTLADMLDGARAQVSGLKGHGPSGATPKALPVGEALAIAGQIANALEAAHELGIIHRDLKPANIKIKDDGTVKVLDFGLAKIAERGGPGSSGGTGAVVDLQVGPTESPTIATPAMTAAGMILGTAAYMAPEQAKGRPADKRSDVWSFGCVLYEMLTGTRAFAGEDIAETLAFVITRTPDWSRVPDAVPAGVRDLLQRCLEKDRRKRIADSSVIRFVIESDRPAEVAAPRARHSRLIIAAAVLITAAVTTAATWLVAGRQHLAPPEVSRLEIGLEPGQRFTGTGRHAVAISSDGNYIAFTANEQLYLRRLDQLTATPIRGSGGGAFAREPFFSPDSKWLGFWHEGYLKKVPVAGGAPLPIGKAENPWGVSWDNDGTILYGQGTGGIWRINAEGGEGEVLIPMEPGWLAHGPQRILNGQAVLFTMLDAESNGWEQAQIVVRTMSDGALHVLARGAADGRYLPGGQIMYAVENSLLVAPLNTTDWTLGAVVTRIDDVARAPNGQTAVAHYDVSATGTMIYVPGSFRIVPKTAPVWVDRGGAQTFIGAEPHQYLYPRVSPDGSSLLISIRDQFESIWSWDFGRRTLSRLTNTGIRENYPLWMPDGKQLIYSVSRGGNADLWIQAADGSGTPTSLTQTLRAELGTSVTPDGTRVIFQDPNSGKVNIMSLTGDRKIEPLLDSRFTQRNGEVSPDGRWLAYESNESGAFEVYVRPFPNVSDSRFPISSGGGLQPLWGRDMKELFFVRRSGELLRVPLVPGNQWRGGSPEHVLDSPLDMSLLEGISGRQYDISPDGRRFVFLKPVPAGEQPRVPSSVVVVQHWTSELARARAEQPPAAP